MTQYLYFSEAEENFNLSAKRKDGRYNRLCIYLDSFGEPTLVTEVSPWPKGSVRVPDLVCIDKVEKAVCLVAAGALQDNGEKFCRDRGIALSVDALLAYMRDLDITSEVVRKPFAVKPALHFKS